MWINRHSISMESKVVERVAPVSTRRWQPDQRLADRLRRHRLHRDHGWGGYRHVHGSLVSRRS